MMADFSTRRVMMVDTQVRPSDVTKFPIIAAMLRTPREAYVPRDLREAAYMGENVSLGAGRVVLEARTLAKLLDALDIQPDEVVLDVGCGLGYSTAIIAQLADAVMAVEEDEGNAIEAQRTLSAEGVDNAAVIAGPLAAGLVKDGGRIGCLFMEGALGEARIGFKSDGQITWRAIFNASAPILPGFSVNKGFRL
jgi:protein-L-isoaspartate(D-aspartate) O-methyltransferase